MGEDDVGCMAMGRAQLSAAAARRAIDHRHAHLLAEHVVNFGRVVDDGVQRQKGEVDGHELGHRSQTAHRRADGHAADGHLRNGRVAHALLAELVIEAACDGIGAAPDADLLAHDEHPLVAVHLLAQRVGDRLPHRDQCHTVSSVLTTDYTDF